MVKDKLKHFENKIQDKEDSENSPKKLLSSRQVSVGTNKSSLLCVYYQFEPPTLYCYFFDVTKSWISARFPKILIPKSIA